MAAAALRPLSQSAAAAFALRVVIGRTLGWSPASFSVARPLSTDLGGFDDFKTIRIGRVDRKFDAYVFGRQDAPGIVLLQGWWGGVFEMKVHAQIISKLGPGFKTLIPDLYRGKDALDWEGALKDIQASVKWLKANGSEKVGVTGFGRGGALSIASSVWVPQVDAAVAFYGVPPSGFADPARAKAPVQAHFGELDDIVGFSDVMAAKDLEEKLKASGVPSEIHIYPGRVHGFMNRSPEAVEKRRKMGIETRGEADPVLLAWSRFKSWMTSHLSP